MTKVVLSKALAFCFPCHVAYQTIVSVSVYMYKGLIKIFTKASNESQILDTRVLTVFYCSCRINGILCVLCTCANTNLYTNMLHFNNYLVYAPMGNYVKAEC